jgi:hypothetical protein
MTEAIVDAVKGRRPFAVGADGMVVFTPVSAMASWNASESQALSLTILFPDEAHICWAAFASAR